MKIDTRLDVLQSLGKTIRVMLSGLLIYIIGSAGAAHSAEITGNITQFRVQTDQQTILFKLDPMPAGVTKWFYITPSSGVLNGCASSSDASIYSHAYSLLLAAKTSNTPVTLSYCVTNTGYGLVNVFSQME